MLDTHLLSRKKKVLLEDDNFILTGFRDIFLLENRKKSDACFHYNRNVVALLKIIFLLLN